MDITKLSQYAQNKDPQLIARIKDFSGREDVQGTKGIQRIEVVCENFDLLSFDQAYHLIDPDTFQEEFEETQSYRFLAKLLNYVRIALSLAPLILTWLALFAATSSYQDDLNKHPADKTITFLQLWQSGFHQSSVFTFSLTAFIDVIFLLSLLGCSLTILWLEYRARQTARRFAEDLSEITAGLLKAVNEEGISPITAQADIDKIVKAVRVALGDAFKSTGDVVKDAMDVVLKANDRVEKLFTDQVQPMFTKFDQNVDSFHRDVISLTRAVSASATASTTLAAASQSMAASATNMATSADTMRDTTKDLDSHLVALNKTEGDMVRKIEVSQRSVTAEMSVAATAVAAAAGQMDAAAQKVETVGTNLGAINPKIVKQLNDNATLFVDKSKETSKSLQDTIVALEKLKGKSRPGRVTRKLIEIFS